LRARGGALLDVGVERGAAGGNLFGGGFGQGNGGLPGQGLFAQGLDAGFGGVASCSGLIVFFDGINSLFVQSLLTLESEAEVFQVGLGLRNLVFGGGKIGLALPDQVAGLRFLEFQIRPGLGDLGGGLLGTITVKGQIGFALGRLNEREHLAVGYRIAFTNEKLLQPALNFRADNNFIGRDHSRQDDFTATAGGGYINGRGHCQDDYDKERNFSLHK
jgi:hypothetical protein